LVVVVVVVVVSGFLFFFFFFFFFDIASHLEVRCGGADADAGAHGAPIICQRRGECIYIHIF